MLLIINLAPEERLGINVVSKWLWSSFSFEFWCFSIVFAFSDVTQHVQYRRRVSGNSTGISGGSGLFCARRFASSMAFFRLCWFCSDVLLQLLPIWELSTVFFTIYKIERRTTQLLSLFPRNNKRPFVLDSNDVRPKSIQLIWWFSSISRRCPRGEELKIRVSWIYRTCYLKVFHKSSLPNLHLLAQYS